MQESLWRVGVWLGFLTQLTGFGVGEYIASQVGPPENFLDGMVPVGAPGVTCSGGVVGFAENSGAREASRDTNFAMFVQDTILYFKS